MAQAAVIPRLTFGELLGTYGKAIAAAVIALLSAYTTARADGAGVSLGEGFVIAAAFVVTFGGVWVVPNVPDKVRKYGKLITGVVLVVISSLGTAATDGSISQTEIINAIVALLGSLVVTGGVSNAAASDPVNAKGHVIPIPEAVKTEIGIEGTTHLSTVNGQITTYGGPRHASSPEDTHDAVIVLEDPDNTEK